MGLPNPCGNQEGRLGAKPRMRAGESWADGRETRPAIPAIFKARRFRRGLKASGQPAETAYSDLALSIPTRRPC
jgi:hypothetical protein